MAACSLCASRCVPLAHPRHSEPLPALPRASFTQTSQGRSRSELAAGGRAASLRANPQSLRDSGGAAALLPRLETAVPADLGETALPASSGARREGLGGRATAEPTRWRPALPTERGSCFFMVVASAFLLPVPGPLMWGPGPGDVPLGSFCNTGLQTAPAYAGRPSPPRPQP